MEAVEFAFVGGGGDGDGLKVLVSSVVGERGRDLDPLSLPQEDQLVMHAE